MNTNDAALMEEPELLTEVPPILKRLAKTIAYAFYDPELVVVVCLLTKHACLDEDTMTDRLQFDKRQLRQSLSRLKSDKLIKQRTIKEKIPETGNFNVYNFYFINYKVFVNVVKYKLDHIRKKLESEEQQARNRPSFQCQDCGANFSDLEVDRLIDLKTGDFVCQFCQGSVLEDPTHVNTYSNGSSLARFNEQLEPIFKLLKACENINLAPDVLEPTPSTADLKSAQNKSSFQSSKSGWTTDKKATNLYDQTMQINIGDEIKQNEEKKSKEQPVWMSKSTVFENIEADISAASVDINLPSISAIGADQSMSHDQDIMSDLLAYENASNKSLVEPSSTSVDVSQNSDSSLDSEPDSEHEGRLIQSVDQVTEIANMDSDSDDDGVHVKIGDKYVLLSDVSEEMIANMTPSEHNAYLKTYHEAYEHFF